MASDYHHTSLAAHRTKEEVRLCADLLHLLCMHVPCMYVRTQSTLSGIYTYKIPSAEHFDLESYVLMEDQFVKQRTFTRFWVLQVLMNQMQRRGLHLELRVAAMQLAFFMLVDSIPACWCTTGTQHPECAWFWIGIKHLSHPGTLHFPTSGIFRSKASSPNLVADCPSFLARASHYILHINQGEFVSLKGQNFHWSGEIVEVSIDDRVGASSVVWYDSGQRI